ncbi:MAG: hypothetical protein HXX14_16945 [Bacteroidetes bacterium]|nr:hypothetical protein [Bacteroidota bacterium]
MKKSFVRTIILLGVSIVLPALSYCQSTTNVEKYLENLPNQLKLDEKTPQKYLMITDYTDYDLFGNFIKKMRITGEYTRGFKDGYVKWNNVKISHSQNLEKPFAEGQLQSVIENFTYVPSAEVLSESFFQKISVTDIYMKNLIWDMMMFEGFAWYKWDSLKLNNEFCARQINSKVKLAGSGTFENKDIRLTWLGITKTNDKVCAIIKYITMSNPLEIDNQNMTIKGRSHYWGNIYVSLSDKQIEYAELYEDVLVDVKMNGQEPTIKGNTVRNITLKKIR